MIPSRVAQGGALTLGVGLLHLVLVMPAHPAGLTLAQVLRPTWELPVVLLALAILPGRWMRGVVVALSLVLVMLRGANIATFMALSRPFNPLLDMHLLVSGWDLLRSSIGTAMAIGAVALVLLALTALTWLLWACVSRWPAIPVPTRTGAAGLALALPLLTLPVPHWRAFAMTPVVTDQISRMSRDMADLSAFTETLSQAPDPQPGFAALEDRDVILAFVESYGRSFLDDPELARTARPRLRAVEERLQETGWHIRSAFAAAPTRGGQSWLSHGTLLSGLQVDSQTRYERLMRSDRASLNRLFGAAGWQTGAAMPAITLDWPEAAWFGYDTTLDADALDYHGQPFEWVTMPDQYTWSAMDRMLRQPGPDMIELALISSHAPWTPLPRILPWKDIGDGAIFDGSHRDGATPTEVWADRESIRRQYARSLDYALEITGQYIARSGDGALFVVLGDHQPAPLITGHDAPPDVPVHIISDDPRLLDRLPADIFAEGIVLPDGPVIPMRDLRKILVTAFETPLEPPLPSHDRRTQ
ncbi:sulfatase [Allosediminivita pacifica]|uniref:Phosphoglycerol transferase MdoB-like AlkP superfamily enzyme n=1 Tax=Allosediminivita pacifica TaxID=1267769 RepID=A0A2T6ABE3_9RHOB|nr:sulfatase [Allosediminivita pacifica]PTX41107.1 phosphoglycerol transferase MdoB-like AlkP superfamily enzyme [Allosediminivita pacifica]